MVTTGGVRSMRKQTLITDNRVFTSQPYRVDMSDCDTARKQCHSICYQEGRLSKLLQQFPMTIALCDIVLEVKVDF